MIESFHIFSIFTYSKNGPNMQKSRKIVSKILKKVDRRKQGKTPQNPSETVSHTFRASVVLRYVNVCDSFTHIQARFWTIWVREDLVKFWPQIRTHRLAECTWKWQNEKSLGIEPFTQIESLKPFLRSFGVFFVVFGDQLFSELSTRFFKIFAYLAHFQGRWKWKKFKKSRSRGAWSPIWVQGLRKVYRGSFRQKRFFVHDPHEKDFRSSPFGYGHKNSEILWKGSMTQKKWRSQRGK